MRQPQLWKASGLRKCASGRMTRAAKIWPAWVPWRVKLPKKPRRPSGAYSMIIELAPEISPATAKPWMRRSVMSSAGARKPTCSYVGRSATKNVETPMRSMHRTSTFLRPCLSPQEPRTNAPIGRAT